MKILLTISFFVFLYHSTTAQIVFKKNDKYGLQDSLGKTLVKAKYDQIDDFKETFLGYTLQRTIARVREKNKWGIIDSKGKEIIKPIFDNIAAINILNSSNLLDVQLNGKWGVFDFDGKEVVTPKYDNAIEVTLRSTYSIVSIIESIIVSSGIQNKLYGLLDSNYKEIIIPKYNVLEKANADYFKVSKTADSKKFGLIDENENVIFDFKYDNIFVISKDIISIKKMGKWFLFNKKGYSISSNEYDIVYTLIESRAKVYRNGKYGYIDEKGKEVISCLYEKGGNFFDGKVKVQRSTQTLEIDLNGNEITVSKTILPRNSLQFASKLEERAFDLISFKENVADSANLKLAAKYLELSNPNQYYKTYIHSIDNLMSEAANNKNAYKVLATYLYNRYFETKYVCHDAILVHISLKYFCDDDAPYGGAYWLQAASKKQVLTYAKLMKPILCDEVAPNFTLKLLPQTNLKYLKLHNINSKYTLLFFWQNDCSYCEKQAKILAASYSNLVDKGLEVVGISLENKNIDKCEQLIVSNDMSWINGIDTDRSISDAYNVTSVSKVYLLDKEKRILLKDVSVEDVLNYLK